MSRRWLQSATLLAAIVSSSGFGADDPGRAKRSHYVVKLGDAKELAAVLSKHFGDDASILAVEGNNALLVRANDAVTEEVTKLLAALDRGGRLVNVELTLVEVGGDKALDEKSLTGPEKTVLEKVAELKKKGAVLGVKRLQFVALENSPITVTVGISQAFTTGVSRGDVGGFRPKGGAVPAPAPVTRSISYRDVGTTAKVTARVGDDKAVTLDVNLEDSSTRESKDGPVLGQDDMGAPIRAPEFVRSSFKTRLSVPAGKAVAAKEFETTAKGDTARTIVIATARLVSAAP